MTTVADLIVYPVKSCAGIPVASWPLDRWGLAHDRSFMVVDGDGRFLTQRHHPRLALVRPALTDDDLVLTVGAAGSVRVPLRAGGGARRTVTVWGHTGPAVDAGDEAADLLGEHLGFGCRLVAMAADHRRRSGYPPPDGSPVAFSDAYPLLLTTTASLADLNERLGRLAAAEPPVPMARFRPNLVVAGSTAFAEDRWRVIRVGHVVVDVHKPCTRCAVTTVDPATGVRRGPEPLRTLGTFRRDADGVTFGQNCSHRAPGTLRIGDPVDVLA